MNETCIKHALNMPDIGGCPYCEIDRLKAELEYTKEMSNAFMDERNNLRIQLSEARAEVDRYKAGVEFDTIVGFSVGDGHIFIYEDLPKDKFEVNQRVRVLIMKLEG